MACILIVDDDESVLKLQKTILSAHGFEVRSAQNGEEALSALKREAVSLVLLDLMMPGMSGIEVCERLRSNDSTKNIPVIFVTAKGAREAQAAAKQAGGIPYLLKPFTASRLVEAVNRALNESG